MGYWFNDQFGSSVAVKGEHRRRRSVRLTGVETTASAYVYAEAHRGLERSSGTQNATLLAADGAVDDQFGISDRDRRRHDRGRSSPGRPSVATANHGSAYVFVKPAAGWAGTRFHDAKLTASDSAAGDELGYPVAISGDTVVVGARLDDVGANTDQGSVYVFVSLRRAGTAR